MATKTICDICNKELDGIVKNYKVVEIDPHIMNSGIMDICNVCMKRIKKLKACNGSNK